ncbi:ribonuclease E [Salmonella bongori]|nr:ribonuclease E [Salmonella bongori]
MPLFRCQLPLICLTKKRTAVNAIETRQDGVRCVIVPNDQMETPHYSVLRVRQRGRNPYPELHAA